MKELLEYVFCLALALLALVLSYSLFTREVTPVVVRPTVDVTKVRL